MTACSEQSNACISDEIVKEIKQEMCLVHASWENKCTQLDRELIFKYFTTQ